MTKKLKRYHKNKISFGESFTIVGSLFLFALLLKNAPLVSKEAASALKICGTLIIPSLFPLTVASEIAAATGALEKITSLFRSVVSKILGIKKDATTPYFLGLLGGYTASCKGSITLYENNKISEQDCESVIAISNMPSLAFLTGFVGSEILHNTTDGWILWAITVFSTVILSFFNRFWNKIGSATPSVTSNLSHENKKKRTSKIIVEAIAHSAQAMLVICACVVFFSVLIRVLELALISFEIPSEIRRIILGALEITYGVTKCSEIQNELIKRVLCAFFIGWSGLCVHFQIISLCEKVNFSFKRYFLLKFLQGTICAFLSYLIFKF